MSRVIHAAYVEERVDEEGDRYFVANCAETLVECDTFAFIDFPRSGGFTYGDVEAMARALSYLGDCGLHDTGEHVCNARHVHAAEFQAAVEEERQ